MTIRRRRSLAFAGTVALLIVTAACSSTDPAAPESASAEGSSPTEAAGPSPSGDPGAGESAAGDSAGGGGGTLTVAPPIPIENLDPHGTASMEAGTQLAARALFSQLVVTTGSGKFTGELATDWSANDDATSWTFTLRDGVKFSDGNPVTAQDVVASFERVLAGDGPLSGNFGGYTVEAKDSSTVVFTSETPDAAFLGKISSFFVTPKQADEDGFFADPIGSGPFVMTSFEPGQKLELAPNPGYWNGAPKLERLVFQSIPEVSARMTALQTGEVDVTWSMPDDQITQLKSDPNITVETIPSPGVFTMWMNSSEPALKDASVRRALWQAVDFKTIIEALYPETGSPADSPISPSVLGYAPQEPVVYDPDAAKAALDAAGFDYDNTVIRFQYSQAKYRQFVQAVVSDLAKIGVKVDPLEKEQAVFLDDLLALNWDMNLQQIGSAGFDAATNLGRLYPCEAKRTGYCNHELDKLLSAAGSTSDTEQRKKLYAEAGKIIWDDAVGMYPMFVKQPYAFRNSVKGLELSPDGMPYFTGVTNPGE